MWPEHMGFPEEIIYSFFIFFPYISNAMLERGEPTYCPQLNDLAIYE